MGSVPLFCNLSKNSVPSSIIVKSAEKLVSNTISKPISRRAVLILPIEFSPGLRLNISPIATRTAGAICATTFLSLFVISPQTRSTLDLIVKAPVGHTA